MLFEKNDRIIFIGDSITDSGRNYDAKPATWSSWGDGYVNVINGYTTALLPEKQLMIVNKGISGDTILDLQRRFEQDVLDFKPDFVTIKIGVNDVWRHFDGVFCQDEMVSVEQFEEVYRTLIEQTLLHVKGIILLSPFMVEANTEDPMRKMVDKYRNVVEKLASEFDLPYGNIQEKIDEYLKHQSSYVLSSDRVHPSLAGHMIIAKTWMETTGIINK